MVDALLQIGQGGIAKQNNGCIFRALGLETDGPISLQWLAQCSGQVPSPAGVEVVGSAVTRLHTVLAGFGRASTVIADVTLPEERKARTTIFDAKPDGTLRQIARIGDPAPGGGRWATFKSVAKPDGDGYGALILGELAVDTAEGITPDKRTALFAVDSEGNLLRILRTGDEIESAGTGSALKTVKTFTALTTAAGSIGAARGYDAEGRVTVLVTFTDRTQAVVVLHVP